MKRFIVQVYELHVSSVEVEAESISHAADLVAEGGGEPIDDSMEYIEVADRYFGVQNGVELPAGIRQVEFAGRRMKQ